MGTFRDLHVAVRQLLALNEKRDHKGLCLLFYSERLRKAVAAFDAAAGDGEAALTEEVREAIYEELIAALYAWDVPGHRSRKDDRENRRQILEQTRLIHRHAIKLFAAAAHPNQPSSLLRLIGYAYRAVRRIDCQQEKSRQNPKTAQ